MKQKINARQRREAEALRRKGKQPGPASGKGQAPEQPTPKPVPKPKERPLSGVSEEETREFLEYLARDTLPVFKDDLPPQKRKKSAATKAIPKLNLEDGMPLVEEAISRMRTGIQEMRVSRVKAVKLIHGYGSSGKGGRIRTGIRSELADMKRKKLIRDWIPGEDFGPVDAVSRKLAENDATVPRDPDWGRMNHGITIVIL